MSTYVIGDIHGCFDEFQKMLDEIGLSDSDRLILVGDYVDRGPQSLEMLRWLERCPLNMIALRGNHDEEFAAYVELMLQTNAAEDLETDLTSVSDTSALYDTTRYLLRKKGMDAVKYFDLYGTIRKLICDRSVTLSELIGWADMICAMPYFVELTVNNRTCAVVHAGYRRGGFSNEAEAAEFFLYAREEAYRDGGFEHGMVISGHTPTVIKGEFTYNDGRVFRYYDKEKDCTFYDIDCGCAFRQKYPNARLACIRLEDETIFYI